MQIHLSRYSIIMHVRYWKKGTSVFNVYTYNFWIKIMLIFWLIITCGFSILVLVLQDKWFSKNFNGFDLCRISFFLTKNHIVHLYFQLIFISDPLVLYFRLCWSFHFNSWNVLHPYSTQHHKGLLAWPE